MRNAALTILLLSASLGAAEQLGCRPPTPDERAWMDGNMVEADEVRLNRTAIDRVNAARRAAGLAELALPAAADGEEVRGRTAVQRAAAVQAARPVSAAPAPLPAAVDNSTLNAFPPVGNQGGLGSCACYATTYYTMTHMTARARGVNAKTGGSATRYSPKFCYNLINGGYDNGSWITTAFAVQLNHGVPTLAAWPYDSDYRAWPTTAVLWRGAIPSRMAVSGTLSGIDAGTGFGNLKRMLANGYVLNFATDIYGWQFTTLGNDPATAADDAFAGQQVCHWYKTDTSGHAMTVVGYNDDLWVDINGSGTVDAGEKGALKIVNNWGTGWKNAGYAWIMYDALKAVSGVSGWSGGTGRTGAWWYNQAYWITARPAHQPTVLAEFTINAAKRSQMLLQPGLSSTAQSSPTTTIGSSLWYAGGPFAFNGTTTAVDATFVLDYTDRIPSGTSRCYLKVQDNNPLDPCLLSACKLTDGAGALLATVNTTNPAGGLPRSADFSDLLAWADLTIGDATAPGSVADLATTLVSPTSVTLTWTATGDDGSSGTASSYDVRYATAPITVGNWASAGQATGEPVPGASGASETCAVGGLAPGTTWYLAVVAVDEAGNRGGISNLVVEATPAVLTITSPSPLPEAPLAAAYATTLSASGGTGSRAWSSLTGHSEHDPGSAAVPAVGTARGWKADTGSWTYAFPTGFTFPFAGSERASVRVSSDGYLEFGSSVTAKFGNDAALMAAPMIAVCWYDLTTAGTAQAGEDIYIAETADTVTIRWVAEWSSGHGVTVPVDAQATLHRDGTITMAWSLTGSISPYVGVSDGDGVHWTRSDRSWQTMVAGTRRTWDYLTWPAGLTLNGSSGLLGGTMPAPGIHRLGIRVADSGYPPQTAAATLDLVVGRPAITSAAVAAGVTGTPFSYQITATNAPTAFAASGLPAGLACDASGLISGTPLTAGSTSATITASNAAGSVSFGLDITITLHPPVITSPLGATAGVDLPFSYQITASHGPDAFSASGLPAGLSCDASGLISGVPAAAGVTTVTITASNAGGGGSASLVITVSLQTPIITSGTTASGTVGLPFSYQITAIGAPATFSATGLPAGLSCDASGVISGTPTAAGTALIDLVVGNAAGSVHAALSLVVAVPGGGSGGGGSGGGGSGGGGGGCGAGGLAALLLAAIALAASLRRRD